MRCVVDEECAEGLVFAILLHNKKTQQRDGPAADDATCHAGGDQLRLLVGHKSMHTQQLRRGFEKLRRRVFDALGRRAHGCGEGAELASRPRSDLRDLAAARESMRRYQKPQVRQTGNQDA